MRRFILSTLLLAALPHSMAAQSFARGADTSWSTEMEADGKHFYNSAGQQTEISALMKECGMNAIRLRVWVEPTMGGWCSTEDVVSKALAAKAQGMDILIDFHYSDFFADPSRQAIPAAWRGATLDELAQHVARHTTEVLTALKAAGVTPKWVQLGNETRNGMLYSTYDATKRAWVDAAGATGSTLSRQPQGAGTESSGGWANYVRLSNAGYDAAKAVVPDVVCMSHLDTRSSDEDLSWWFTAFRQAGGKLDMVGLSHYPMAWNSGGEQAATASGKQRNEGLMKVVANTFRTVQTPIMIVETGVYCEYVNGGREVMQDLFDKCRARDYVKGIFYWEPEQWGWWKPAVYSTIGWSNYNMCAFLGNGRPSAILAPWLPSDAEREAEAAVAPIVGTPPASGAYDASGRRTTDSAHGLRIEDGRKVVR